MPYKRVLVDPYGAFKMNIVEGADGGKLVVEGKTSAGIAGDLLLSPKTIETYRSRLMHKLGVDSLPDLVKFAIRHGLTSVD